MDRSEEQNFESLSPFELKDQLILLANEEARRTTHKLLNAGRGNPNWLAITPREGMLLLNRFALDEAKRGSDIPHLGWEPKLHGIAHRLEEFLGRSGDDEGATFLRAAIEYGEEELGFDPDDFVGELVDGLLGDHYPFPDRMLSHTEQVVARYLGEELFGGQPPKGRFQLFATEGGTAAMCYVFNSLIENRLLHRGDTIAIGVPAFTPYLEIPKLNDYGFKVVPIQADPKDGWQYPDSELDKLQDPSIQAFFLINPSNPPSVAMRPSSLDRLAKLVKNQRPELIVLTDDVYAPFVSNYRSLLAALPRNTIGVYSFSKFFGCTGWRLGVIALHEANVLDARLARLPSSDRAALDERYKALTLRPSQMRFIDRMVADSRQVALNHTAGLSTPQQVQMCLFSLFSLLPEGKDYKKATNDIIQRRLSALYESVGLPLPEDPLRAGYYAMIDLRAWGEKHLGADFVKFLEDNYEPVDIVFRLAEQYSVVLLNGGGFEGPDWSVRVSLANLPDQAYAEMGEQMAAVARSYVQEWRKQRGEDGEEEPSASSNGTPTVQ